MKLSKFAIYKPITTIMIVLSIVVMGFISLFRLPLEYLPSLTFPVLFVTTFYPSSSPHEVERFITRPLEETLSTMTGIENIGSVSTEASSTIRIEFPMGADMNLIGIHLRDRLDQVLTDLPEDATPPLIKTFATEDIPVYEASLTMPGQDKEAIREIYEKILYPRLLRLEGVADVSMKGSDRRQLMVKVDQKALLTYKMDLRTINRALARNNINRSAGYVTDAGKRHAVRSIGEFETVDQIRDLPIRPNLTLGDLATITYEVPDLQGRNDWLDGIPAKVLSVQKSSTANVVNVCRLIRREMDIIQEEIGRGKLIIHIIRDQSTAITASITSLAQSALMGGVLAVIAIFVFLRNFRSTLIIGSAIPISAFAVFLIMYLLRQSGADITLNLISMMGLMVAIGMLVDPAVVALENIFRKRFDENQDAFSAALEGSEEVGIPILAASLTTVCVFVPVIFITDSGSALFMQQFAVTVVVSVIASFCIALSLIPLAASRAFNPGGHTVDRVLKSIVGFGASAGAVALFYYVDFSALDYQGMWANIGKTTANLPFFVQLAFPLSSILAVFLYFKYRATGAKTLYANLVTHTLHYRWVTLSFAVLFLFMGYHTFTKIEQQPFQRQPNRSIRLSIQMPRTYTPQQARETFVVAEDILLANKEKLDIDVVLSKYNGKGNRQGLKPAQMDIYLVSAEKARLTTDEIQAKILSMMPKDIPGVKYTTRGGKSGGGAGVGVELKGRDQSMLAVLALDLEESLKDLKGVQQIETSLETGTEEIQVRVNRERAQRYGVSPHDIAISIASALGSRGGSKFKSPDGEINITVQLREEDRATLEQLKNTSFASTKGGMVNFANLADFHLTKGADAISRENRMPTLTVYANTEQKNILNVGRAMQAHMENVPLPKGYRYEMDKKFQSVREERGQDVQTMIFAIILIYIIMASLFESYVHPLTIMFCIFFAFIGVAFGLYTFKIALDSNAKYGLLVLFGIVVNNGIVLVDHINRYRKQGLSRRDVIIRGGQDRLRPILMTATTTIIGLMLLVIPMLFGSAEGTARRWGPIGLVVVSGLSVSTILTLILLPTVYSLLDDLSHFIKRVAAVAHTS